MSKIDGFKRLILQMLICSFAFIIVSCITTISGNSIFVIITNFEFPNIIGQAVSYGLFFINLFFWFSIALDMYRKEVVFVLIFYIPFFLMSIYYDENSLVASTILPCMYLLFVGAKLKRLKQTVINSAVFLAITSIYQVLSLLAKTSIFTFGYTETSTEVLSTYSIDLVLFYCILFLYGRYLYYERKQSNRLFRKYSILAKDFKNVQLDEEDIQALKEWDELTPFQTFKAVLILTLFQIFQMSLVFVLCILGGAWVECIFIMAAFFFASNVIKRRWHSHSVLACTLITAFLFYTLSRLALPLNVSILACMLEGFILTFALYRVDVNVDNYRQLKEKVKPQDKETPP